jgi:hypothetical protein
MDKIVRARHKAEIAALTELGFQYLCSEGERFPLTRLLRVFPALVTFGMLFQRTPLWIQSGCIVFGYPVLIWRQKPTFVELDASHAKFITLFEGGLLLVSGNYDDPLHAGPGISKHFQAGSLVETWDAHKARMEELEAKGRRVDARSDYAAYRDASEQVVASW